MNLKQLKSEQPEEPPKRRRRGVNRRAKDIEDVVTPAKIRTATLAEAFPEVAVEWYYKKNCGWGPEDFNYASNVKAWWRCSEGHIYPATITNRTNNGSGCMICNVGESTDLRDYPEALAQFDFEKNKDVDPHKLYWHAFVHWKCPIAKDHKWVSTFNRRHGERCPACKKAQLSKTNSLATVPEIATLLHPTKNGKIKATDLRMSEHRIVWWKCPAGPDHEWKARISTKFHGSRGCPFCNGNRVSITNCLLTLFPKIAKEWHWKRNGSTTPADVHARTMDQYWWKCKKDHEWLQAVQLRTARGRGCRICRKEKAAKERRKESL